MIHPERLFAKMDGPFVVFMIGMRINHFWKPHKWWPVAMAMPRMLKELKQKPELGYLGGELWNGRTTIAVQYWRSSEQLMAYAKDRQSQHLPAWAAFNKAIGQNGDVGIWHETYVIEPGQYENVYANMPAFGLGKVGTLVPATAGLQSAKARMAASKTSN